jgi:hypothetical protein
MAEQWKTIETAPTDDLMLVTNRVRIALAFRDSGMSSYRFFCPHTMSDLEFWPTHWLPVPAIPCHA